MDNDGTPESRALLARFEGSGRFQVVATPHSERRCRAFSTAATRTPWCACCPTSRATWRAAGRAEVQVLLDGTNSNTASLVSAYADQVIADFSDDVAAGPDQERSNHQADGPRLRARAPVMTSSLATAEHARVVQPRPAQPQLLRPRRRRQHPVHGDAHADRAGHHPREGDRHHGAVDGDAHAAHRADAGQDAAVRPDRTGGPGAGDGGRAGDFPRSVPRQFSGAALQRDALPADQPGRGPVPFHHLAHPAAGQHGCRSSFPARPSC